MCITPVKETLPVTLLTRAAEPQISGRQPLAPLPKLEVHKTSARLISRSFDKDAVNDNQSVVLHWPQLVARVACADTNLLFLLCCLQMSLRHFFNYDLDLHFQGQTAREFDC